MIPFLSTLAEHYIIVLFLFLNLAIGFWAHTKAKANSFEDYALASRSLPTGVLVMTLLGTVLDTGIFKKPGNVFGAYGLLQCGSIIAYMTSFWFIGTFIAPFFVYFGNCLTVGDLMKKMYGSTARLLTGILSCIVCLLMIAPQLQAISKIINYLLEIDDNYTIIGLGLLAVLYSVFGGMRSVSYTDILQVITIVIAASWIAHSVFQKVGGLQNVLVKIPEEKMQITSHPKFTFMLKSWAFWRLIPVFLLTPPVIQRMLIVQDKRQVRSMWYISAFLYSLIVMIFIFIGLGAIIDSTNFELNGNNKELLSRLIKNLFSKKIIELLSLGLIAVALSTIDSYLHAIGITIVQDILEPVNKILGFEFYTSDKKTIYAQIGIAFIGCIAVLIAFMQGSMFFNREAFQLAVVIYTLVIIPLIIGIIGIKTDKASWISFCITYLALLGGAYWLEWHVYDSFLVALPLGILAYFATHTYINGGIVILKRSEQTIAEQLWIPTWQGTVQYMKSWLFTPFQLHKLASRKIVNSPTHSLSFSMLIFALYTFSCVMTGVNNDLGLANFMAGIHVVGITLCAGLMLEGIWPARLKPYFALYWFFTLFYCLAFGSTLAFLRAHGDTIAVGKWIVNFIFLFALVDSMSFITLSCLGSGLAMASWYVLFGSLPADLLGSIGLLGGYLLFGLLVAVLLFERSKERDLKGRFYLKSAFSHAMTHESTQPLSEISVLSTLQQRAIDELSPMQNAQGEKGFWIPASKQVMLQKGSQQIGKAVQEIKHEFGRFNKLIEDEISALEKEKVSMQSLIESIVPTLPKKHTNRIKVKVECTKDFEVSVVRPLFANVLTNLLKNAYLHGNASEMRIHIDGEKRKLSVHDNGRGIKVESLARIFELHFTTGGEASNGVGLALVKSIVQASGGKISCHSRHGDKESFTEFIMEFPEV